MAKVNYENITFDSELEVEYYKYLKNNPEVLEFKYHPISIPNLVGKRSYTPDFIVLYKDKIEVVECKGWNQFSYRIDDQIHNIMLSKDSKWLSRYVEEEINTHIKDYTNFSWYSNGSAQRVFYKKIKYLKAYGFVDWDFKNPNTIANKRKEKITELSSELKELRQFKKDTIRYFNLHNKSKLTANQKEFIAKYLNQFYTEDE